MLQSVAAVAVGLMVSLPFLYPAHTYPIPTFFEEAFAFAAGLLAFACVVLGARSAIAAPAISVWIAVLSAYLLLQPRWMELAYAEPAQMAGLYALWAAAMAMVGANLRLALGTEKLASLLAGAMLISAVLDAGSGLAQALDLSAAFRGIVAPSQGSVVYGNLGQRNLFANHLVIGAACLAYLWSARRISLALALTCGVLLAHGIDASGSRASLLMLGWLMVWAWWQSRRASSQPAARRFLAAIAAVIVVVGVFGFFAATPDGPLGSASARLVRVDGGGGGPSVRLAIYEAALRTWMSAPLFGVGFGGFSWAHYTTPTPWAGTVPMNPETNAHNILLHFLAETGMAGTSILAVGLALWCARLWSRGLSPSVAWAAAVVGVELIHSLVEYPLWHAQFLGLAAVLAGFADPRSLTVRSVLAARALAAGVLLLGGALLVTTTRSYLKLQYWGLLVPQALRSSSEVRSLERQAIAEVQRSLLRPYADVGLAASLKVSSENLDAKLSFNARVLHFWQIYPLVEAQIAMLAMAGRDAEALRLLDQVARLQPQNLPELAAFLDALPDSQLPRNSAIRAGVASLIRKR
jgi:O-antigen ligase